MRLLLRAIAVALPLAAGAVTVVGSDAVHAQQDGLPSAEPQALAERKRLLTDILTRAVPASRLPQIYADLRYAFAELYLPALRDMVKDPAYAERDLEKFAKLTALLPLMDYSVRAANELDVVLSASRDELIADIADHQAKYSSEEEIRFVGEILDTPATRKGFNALYAFTRFLTAYDKEDIRASREMSAWMKDWKFDPNTNPFTSPQSTPPSPGKVAKATAIVTDFMRVARLDDIVSEIVSFMRNVVLEVDALKPDEVAMMRTGLEQFEFYYNLGKSMAVAVAPSGLAAAMTEEQLSKFHLMVISPVMSKSFGLLYGAVRESTSFTKQDITEFRHLAEKGEAAGEKWQKHPELKSRMNAEWEALSEKWRNRFEASLSPETRQGLETSYAAFQKLVEEEEAQRKQEQGEEAAPEGEQKL